MMFIIEMQFNVYAVASRYR